LGFGGSTSSRRRLEIGQIFCAAVGTTGTHGHALCQQSPLPTETAGRLLPSWLLPLAAAASHLTPQRWCWRSGMRPQPQPVGDMSVHGRWLQDKLTAIAYCDLQGAAQAPWPRTAHDPKLAATQRARGYLRHCGIVIASSSRQGKQGSESRAARQPGSQSSPNSSERRHTMSQLARGGRDTAPSMSWAVPFRTMTWACQTSPQRSDVWRAAQMLRGRPLLSSPPE
jgi:hypothetical protein